MVPLNPEHDGATFDQRTVEPWLADYREDLQGECWWCGAPADSLEHRHKRSDLVRLAGIGKDELVLGRGGEELLRVRGPGSRLKSLRFGPVLCQLCNNQRSQPFDVAYQTFSNALVARMDEWWLADGINMQSIFGSDWIAESRNLARYYVKNFGCAMADDGVKPPQSMRDFSNGQSVLPDVALCLVKSEQHHAGHLLLRELGPNDSLWRSDGTAHISPTKGRFVGYSASTLIGYVGVSFEWKRGERDLDSFFPHPFPILNVIAASPGWHEGFADLGQRHLKDR